MTLQQLTVSKTVRFYWSLYFSVESVLLLELETCWLSLTDEGDHSVEFKGFV